MVIHRTNPFYKELLADGHVAEDSQVEVVEPYCRVEKSPFRLCRADNFLVSDSNRGLPNLDPDVGSSCDPCPVERVPVYNLSELPYSPAAFVEPMELIKDLGLEVENKRGRVLVANSQVELVSQEIVTPVEFHNRLGETRVRALKSLPVTF